jgi:hypothetical protein
MEEFQSSGRIVIPFVRDDFPSSPHNLKLEEGDCLSIPPQRETVAILGHVFNPGSFVAEPGLKVEDLLARSGGIQDEGDDQRLYLIRADGTVQSLDQAHYNLDLTAQVLPGDVVLVPRRPLSRTFGNQLTDVLAATRRLAEIALIFSNISDFEQLQFTSLLQEPRHDGSYSDLQRALMQSSLLK